MPDNSLAAGGSVTATIQALADGNRVDDALIVTAYGGTPLMTLVSIEIDVKDANELPEVTAKMTVDVDGTATAVDDETGVDEGTVVMLTFRGG